MFSEQRCGLVTPCQCVLALSPRFLRHVCFILWFIRLSALQHSSSGFVEIDFCNPAQFWSEVAEVSESETGPLHTHGALDHPDGVFGRVPESQWATLILVECYLQIGCCRRLIPNIRNCCVTHVLMEADVAVILLHQTCFITQTPRPYTRERRKKQHGTTFSYLGNGDKEEVATSHARITVVASDSHLRAE